MIEKLVNGDHLKCLDNIIQWQERDVNQRESVSQHSFKVAVFTRIILEDIFGTTLNGNIEELKLKCVTHAIFHDWDESIFKRDVSHDIKYNVYNGMEVRDAINHYVKHQFASDFQEQNEHGDTDSYKMLESSIITVPPIVKKIVKVADWLALLYFCNREIAMGNLTFKETLQLCKENVEHQAHDMAYTLAALYTEVDANKIMNKIFMITNETEKLFK